MLERTPHYSNGFGYVAAPDAFIYLANYDNQFITTTIGTAS